MQLLKQRLNQHAAGDVRDTTAASHASLRQGPVFQIDFVDHGWDQKQIDELPDEAEAASE